MDRTELSSAIIQEMQALVGEALAAVVPEILTADLTTLEQRVQQVGRVILGGLVERVAARQGQGLPRPARCPACHGALKRRERPRDLVGLVGDYTLRRAYYWCAACQRGTAPLDAALGLGPGEVSPGLARVVARTAVEATFTSAAEQVQEALGAMLSDETVRRLAERIGAAAEAQTQAAITRAKRGQLVWTEDEMERAVETTILAVEVDGVLVHQGAGWHEMKVEARLKQAGMRWGLPGSQAIATLRALHRSGRWAAFWQTHPDQYQPPTEEAAPPIPRVPAASAPRPAVTAARTVSAPAPRVATRTATARAAPRPTPTRAQRPLLLPRSA